MKDPGQEQKIGAVKPGNSAGEGTVGRAQCWGEHSGQGTVLGSGHRGGQDTVVDQGSLIVLAWSPILCWSAQGSLDKGTVGRARWWCQGTVV